MGIDTKIILISCIVTVILTKEGFSVMAALICKLGELPKDDRVASFRFLKSTSWRYGNSKKTLYGRYCTLIGPCHQTINVWQTCCETSPVLENGVHLILCTALHYCG